MVAELVGIVGQPTIMRLMSGLRPARTSVLAFLFLVCGRRLGRSPRRFIRSLQLQNQINQLVLAQALQISPFHARMDSEIALHGKGVGKYRGTAFLFMPILAAVSPQGVVSVARAAGSGRTERMGTYRGVLLCGSQASIPMKRTYGEREKLTVPAGQIADDLYKVIVEEGERSEFDQPEKYGVPETYHVAFHAKMRIYREALVLFVLIIKSKKDEKYEPVLRNYEALVMPTSPPIDGGVFPPLRSGHDRGGAQRILSRSRQAKGESRIRRGCLHWLRVFTRSAKFNY